MARTSGALQVRSASSLSCARNVHPTECAGDGHLDVVKQLVAGGVTVDAKDSNGYTPL